MQRGQSVPHPRGHVTALSEPAQLTLPAATLSPALSQASSLGVSSRIQYGNRIHPDMDLLQSHYSNMARTARTWLGHGSDMARAIARAGASDVEILTS